MPLKGKKAKVQVSGDPIAFVDEPFSDVDGGRITYQIDDVAKRVWDPTAAITVEQSTDGGIIWNPVSAYTPNRLAGSVTFNTQRDVDAEIRASGSYLPLSTATEAYSFTLSLSANNQSVSRFGDDFIRRDQMLKDVAADLSQWRTLDKYFDDALDAGELIVIEFHVDESGPHAKMWTLIADQEIAAAVDAPIDETASFEGSDDADGRAIAFVS